MGSGSSREPVVGAPANPRVVYADQLSKREKKKVLLDTPVLIDIQHGSVRYRYTEYDGEPRDKTKRIEKPYEGRQACNKKNYFYHPRLNSYGSETDSKTQSDYKVMHVIKGPDRAKQKKLFYVYGYGWDAKDGLRVKPTLTKEEGTDFSWPQLRIPNDLYYNLHFQDDEKNEELLQEEKTFSSSQDKIRLTLCNTEKVSDVKAKLAVKVLKAAYNIHVCFNKQELRNDDVIGELRSDDKDTEIFPVEMKLI